MDLKDVAAVAKQHITSLFAAEAPKNIRLEGFLYDDHLMVWSLTIGFVLGDRAPEERSRKIVLVSEADKTVVSVRDP